MATSQEMPAATRSWRRQGANSLGSLEGTWSCHCSPVKPIADISPLEPAASPYPRSTLHHLLCLLRLLCMDYTLVSLDLCFQVVSAKENLIRSQRTVSLAYLFLCPPPWGIVLVMTFHNQRT